MTNDWIMRVGDGENFRNSSLYNIWGVNSRHKTFIQTVQPGDRIWFVVNGGGGRRCRQQQQVHLRGKVIAVATYQSHNHRELGPLVSFTQTNDELGWGGCGEACDIEIHYSDLYDLNNCEMFTHIKNQNSVRNFATAPCAINLPIEYNHIVRYSKVTRRM